MSQPIEAIYENGLLRPLEPLALPEFARVQLDVRTVERETLSPVTEAELIAQTKAHQALLASLAGVSSEQPADGWDSSRADEVLYGWKK
jgi:predicted DNA-binding antitoxin AbrB/MazE fold protein